MHAGCAQPQICVHIYIYLYIPAVVSLGFKQVMVPEMGIWGSRVWSKSDSSMGIRLRFKGLPLKAMLIQIVVIVVRTVIAMVTTVDQVVMIINRHQSLEAPTAAIYSRWASGLTGTQAA